MNRIADWIFNSIKWPEKLDFDSWTWAHYLLFENKYSPKKTKLSGYEMLLVDTLNPIGNEIIKSMINQMANMTEALVLTNGEL